MSNDFFWYTKGKSKMGVRICDIEYFSCNGHKITIKTISDEIVYNGTLKEIQDLVDKNTFVQINKSDIVNLSYIYRFEKNDIVLINGKMLPFTKHFKQIFYKKIFLTDRKSVV